MNKLLDYYKKVIMPTPEELKLYKEYIKISLKNIINHFTSKIVMWEI